VLADGGLRERKNTDDFTANARIALHQVLYDLDPRGMTQGLENF